MSKRITVIPVYIIAHFVVDFACAFLTFRILRETSHWYIGLLIYNFCAFALQMPIGLLADRFNHNAICAAIGCGMVALAYPFGASPIVAAVLAGIGNGMFHIGGGIEVLNSGEKKPLLLGIFVSPGALGIYLGTMLGKQRLLPSTTMVRVLICILLLILISQYIDRRSFRSDNAVLSLHRLASPGVLAALGSLLMVVILRSYIGMTSNFAWKGNADWATLYVVAVVLGKICGGILAVPLGIKKTSILSLGLAAGLFLLSNIPVLGVMAVFFFNMTMPLTLWAVAKLLSGSKGFSFGLLTFGLFLGFVPPYLDIPSLFTTTTGFMVASLLSLLLLLYGLRKVVD
jgi:FSR family fosmidomycin resistance protein-like MFS transporter